MLAYVLFITVLIGAVTVVSCGKPAEQISTEVVSEEGTAIREEWLNPVERVWAEVVPEEGTATRYGIPLSLDDAQQFIDWYNSIELSAEEEWIRDAVLDPLVAPCCDDYPMSSCCCECNLARSVWGLSAYLITEKHYEVDQVQEAAAQWLHFIRPDYYVAKALEEEGIDPQEFGFITASSCYSGRCEFSFYGTTPFGHIGGCGGMEELISM
jgi:hypothetical protein